MTKLELQSKRLVLIEELRGTGLSAQRRLEIQRQLSEVNADLKRINTDEADRAKAEADQRKARGLAEQADNIARSKAPVHRAAARAAESQIGKMTHGEFLLKHATRMLRTIETIKEPLPFTVDMYNALVAFVAQQRVHVRDAKRDASPTITHNDPGNWQQVWKDAGVFDGIKVKP